MSAVPPIAEVIAQHTGDTESLARVLTEREDQIATYMLQAGANLGGDPAFVAKALLDIGVGTPPTQPEADLINRAFAERVAYYQQQQQPPQGGEGT
jgi:hypothetical protein